MAGQQTFFLTGANAKIIINHRTIAFCTNISYSVMVNHAAPVLLGMYESSSVEPLSYAVTGSFSIIRYVAGIKSKTDGNLNGIEVQDVGNGVGAWGPKGIADRLKAGIKIDQSKADGKVYESLNPKKLEKATGFDIEIHQKYDNGSDTHTVSKIRECRITSSNFTMSNKGYAIQNFSFRALYADEDSFLADFSGSGQHLI